MSHLSERKENNCLNCNARVYGTYCHICGQENIHPKESVWHLTSHYFQDITHFDGKFFSTIKQLILRPGFLSAEYARGRRISYLNPIRMYVFTSAFFFLIFFTFVQKDEDDTPVVTTPVTASIGGKLDKIKKGLQAQLAVETDSSDAAELTIAIKKIDSAAMLLKTNPDAADSIRKSLNKQEGFLVMSNNYNTQREYDSAQLKLAPNDRANWLTKKMEYKMIVARHKYNGDSKKIQEAILHKFKHSFPQLLFLSLPLFALTLKILYVRRKQFFYVNHIIFTIHLYCAIFILLLIIFGINGLQDKLHWGIFTWIKTLLWIGLGFYEYKCLRNFYQQRRAKTITKFVILNFATSLVIGILTGLLLLFSAYQI